MRGDGVGVGDVGEVHADSRDSGHATGGDDGRGSVFQRDIGLYHRVRDRKPHAIGESCWVGLGICDGAWGRFGACCILGTSSDRAYGVRGDGVGVRDVNTVCPGPRSERDPQNRHDVVGAYRQRLSEHEHGRWPFELRPAQQQGWHRCYISDGTRVQHGPGHVYREHPWGCNRMRGN